MANIVTMPKLSDTMTEGVVSKWLLKEGEKVKRGQPIVEIETDKANMEYESSASGILLKILVADSEKCALQAPIAVIGKDGENWQDALKAATATTKKKDDNEKVENKTAKEEKQSISHDAPAAIASQGDRVKVSPLAKKIATERGLDLSSISGSGPNGRIIIRDLEGSSQTQSTLSSSLKEESVKIPLSSMRKVIAKRLTQSMQESPHFYLKIGLDITKLLEWRKEILLKIPKEDKFSINDIVMFLTARALRKHPEINSSWKGDHILEYRDVHMCMAVALESGLVTPVIRHCDKLSLLDIAKESKRLVGLAKNNKLSPQDSTGGTFTISNLGMNDIEDFTAIINPPQAAILAVGASKEEVALEGEKLKSIQRMRVTLSCDHRVIDGAVGSYFLKTLKGYFEDPYKTLFMI